MPHYLIKETQRFPGLGAGQKLRVYGPVEAINPEEAVRSSDAVTVGKEDGDLHPEPHVTGGSVSLTVYVLQDDADGEGPIAYDVQDDL